MKVKLLICCRKLRAKLYKLKYKNKYLYATWEVVKISYKQNLYDFVFNKFHPLKAQQKDLFLLLLLLLEYKSFFFLPIAMDSG